ncbi:MAG TPA: glycine--tRNA ligase subunit beta, partial [Trueperaceae bacterium]|nr:glycine--tRNA ligase subunit beta [Trueperaceae bacterium]
MTSSDLLFEIGTEELPSWYVGQGSAALAELVNQRLSAAGFAPRAVSAYGTPRRLSVIAHDVPLQSEERVEERRGPGAGVAFAHDGTPTRAAEAFASSSGVAVTELEVRENDKGASYVYAKVKRGGEEAAAVLPAVLAAIVPDLPAPRKMRWASESVAFVRPIAWLLAMHGERVMDLDVAGVRSGPTSRGHRFLAPDPITIAGPGEYAGALRAARVEADSDSRRAVTLEAGTAAAAAEGLTLYEDAALLDEVAGLV